MRQVRSIAVVGSLLLVVATLSAQAPSAPVLATVARDAAGDRPRFLWMPVPEATWYYLRVQDRHDDTFDYVQWFTSEQARCASGLCGVTPEATLPRGEVSWSVVAWSPAGGHSPWSDGLNNTVRPVTWRGAWNVSLVYRPNDLVGHGAGTWLALTPNGGTTPSEGNEWALLARQGEQGPRGVDGAPGAVGPRGPQGPAGPQGSPGAQRFSVCISNARNTPSCGCSRTVSTTWIASGTSCTTSGVSNACTAVSVGPPSTATSGACCVCE